MSRRLERAKAIWTRSAISIQASSRDDGCINRPDTRKHLNPRNMPSKTSCIQRGVHTRTFLLIWEAAIHSEDLPSHESHNTGDDDLNADAQQDEC